MTGHITKSAGSEIPPATPVPWGINFIEWTHGSCSNKQIPVQCLWSFHKLSWPLKSLRPDRTVRPGMYLFNLTNFAIPYPLAKFPDTVAGITLIPHLSCYLVFNSQFSQES